MASRIKGITVEIGGDTTGLDKALKSVNSSIKTTQSGLKDVSKLLKLDPTNTELLTQKQKLLKDAIGSTKEKLDALKLAQEQAKAQLESGDLGQDKYDALQREIIETEQELKRLQEQAIESNAALAKIEEVGDKLQTAGDKISGAGQKLLPVTAAVAGLGNRSWGLCLLQMHFSDGYQPAFRGEHWRMRIPVLHETDQRQRSGHQDDLQVGIFKLQRAYQH